MASARKTYVFGSFGTQRPFDEVPESVAENRKRERMKQKKNSQMFELSFMFFVVAPCFFSLFLSFLLETGIFSSIVGAVLVYFSSCAKTVQIRLVFSFTIFNGSGNRTESSKYIYYIYIDENWRRLHFRL